MLRPYLETSLIGYVFVSFLGNIDIGKSSREQKDWKVDLEISRNGANSNIFILDNYKFG